MGLIGLMRSRTGKQVAIVCFTDGSSLKSNWIFPFPLLAFPFLRYGVVSASSPRVAAQYAPYGEGEALYRSVFLKRLLGVF